MIYRQAVTDDPTGSYVVMVRIGKSGRVGLRAIELESKAGAKVGRRLEERARAPAKGVTAVVLGLGKPFIISVPIRDIRGLPRVSKAFDPVRHFERMYRRLPAYRLVVDGTRGGGTIDLSRVEAATVDPEHPDAMSPAEWVRHRRYGSGSEGVAIEGGSILADELRALDYLGFRDPRYTLAMHAFADWSMQHDPSAFVSSPVGAYLAQCQKVADGSHPEDAKAELIADVMERSDELPPAAQAEIVAEARRNLDASGVVNVRRRDD